MKGKALKLAIITVLILLVTTVAYAGWSSKLNISKSSSWSNEPAIVSVSGRVHIVWQDGGDIFYKKFNGTAWSNKTKVTIGDFNIAEKPKLAIAGGKVHIAWRHFVNNKYQIYYRSFDGSKWSNISNVSQTKGYSDDPLIVAYRGTAHIVWVEDTNRDYSDDEIYYRRVNGTTWSSKVNVSASSSSESTEPSISIDGGNVRVVWTDNISGNREIFYRTFKP